MKHFEYSARSDEFFLDGQRAAIRRRYGGAYFACLEQVAEGSLISLKTEARRLDKPIHLKLAAVSRDVFFGFSDSIMAELVSINTDGRSVWVEFSSSTFEPPPELRDPEQLHAHIEHILQEPLTDMPLNLDAIDVQERSHPEDDSIPFTVRCKIDGEHRSVGQAYVFGEALYRRASDFDVYDYSTAGGIAQLLKSAPGLLIGLPESQYLEAKRVPYRLENENQKAELAKDIAAFANSGGGILVIGFRTRRKDGIDTISDVNPFSSKLLDTKRIHQILRSRIFPQPRGICIEQIESGAGAVGFILIPNQRVALQPFILHAAARRGPVQTKSIAIPERIGADTDWQSIESIHSLVVAGRVALSQPGAPHQ